MSTRPLVPTADNILTPGLEAHYASRPGVFPHINLRKGVYWHPWLGFRGQAAQAIRRLAFLTANNRLSTAEGQELKDYVASEYDAIPDTGRTFAIGELSLVRTTSTTAGDVPKGTRFSRKANLASQIPLQSAEYETLGNAHFEVGQTVVGPIPIRAIVDGAAANHPIRTDSSDHGVTPTAGRLFDKTITVSTFGAGGGSDGAGDPYVRRYATAYAIGQYGPTDAESRYGALKETGVRNILVFDEPGTGTEKILIADESWGSSTRWASHVQQSLYDDDLVGIGCKVSVQSVRNKVVTAEATVVLRDKNFASETTALDEAIGKAVRSYFDDRVDWNVWKSRAIRAAITNADEKILHCSSITIKDVTGAPLSEIATPNYADEQLHYYLANNAVKVTYIGPG